MRLGRYNKALLLAINDDNRRTRLIGQLKKADKEGYYTATEISRMNITQLENALKRIREANRLKREAAKAAREAKKNDSR